MGDEHGRRRSSMIPNTHPLYMRNTLYYEETGSVLSRLFVVGTVFFLMPVLCYFGNIIANYARLWTWSIFATLVLMFCGFHIIDACVYFVKLLFQNEDDQQPPPPPGP